MRPKLLVAVFACMLITGLGADSSAAAAGAPAPSLVVLPPVGPDWADVTTTVEPQSPPIAACTVEYGVAADSGSAPCSVQTSVGGSVVLSARLTGLTPSTTYHYRFTVIDQNGPASTSDRTFTTLPPPPAVVIAPATAVTARSVALNGTVDPNGSLVTDCHFEYGATTAYGQQAPCAPMPGSAAGAAPVSATVAWAAGTTLRYRLVASSASGTSTSEDATVTAIVDPPPPPTIGGSTVQRIARPTAVGAGTVNPNGAPTECWFESGSERIPCMPQPGSGTSPVAVTAPVPVFGAIISFRIVAGNAGGTTYGPVTEMAVYWVMPPGPGTPRVTSVARPRHGRIALGIACDGAPADYCRGTLRLIARLRLHGKRRLVVLGAAAYDLTAPQHATLTVRLSRRGRRIVAQRPRLRVGALV